jgi:carbamoyltransferase|tara:strand:- start:1045 stop:2007 length:963 start_codon:yes stop_codon:yes gene_type:complete
MIKWGMVGNSHDASLAVFDDDELLWASLSKDFSKVPNDPDFNWTQLEVARQSFGPPQKVIWYERPFLKTLRQWRAGQGWLREENDIRKYLKRWGINCKIEYTQHHLSHAAYAYYTQPEDDCAVVCLDSIGEFETLTVWHGMNNKLKKIYSQSYPHSLGLFYSAMTQRLGLVPNRDEYLVAQMAAKGNHKIYSKRILKELLHVLGNDPAIHCRENLHRGCMWWAPDITSEQQLNDLAAAVQKVFELSVKHVTEWAKKRTGSKHLALAGGGALNKDAVDKIRRKWKSVYVPQNPGDPGSCIGAVLAKTKTKVGLDKQWYQKL